MPNEVKIKHIREALGDIRDWLGGIEDVLENFDQDMPVPGTGFDHIRPPQTPPPPPVTPGVCWPLWTRGGGDGS